MHNQYIHSVIESCKKDQSYVVMLNPQKIKEIDNLLTKNCTFVKTLTGGIVKECKSGKASIRIYKSGKMIIKHVEDVDNLLNKILG